jgi:hypothetical protein
MPDYIKQLIAEGEHQTLDFKFEVSDFRKIAKTLVAFANTDGGRLLVGVKDNGSIAGVRSEEEYFMVEGASRLYCKPEVAFKVKEWHTEGKRVLEIIIGKGAQRPYLAQDHEGRWIAYIRQGDQNFKVNRITLETWRRHKTGIGTTIHFRQAEMLLLNFLEQNTTITISKFRRLAGLTLAQAEHILTDFIMLGILEIKYNATGAIYLLSPGYKVIIKRLDQSHLIR